MLKQQQPCTRFKVAQSDLFTQRQEAKHNSLTLQSGQAEIASVAGLAS